MLKNKNTEFFLFFLKKNHHSYDEEGCEDWRGHGGEPLRLSWKDELYKNASFRRYVLIMYKKIIKKWICISNQYYPNIN